MSKENVAMEGINVISRRQRKKDSQQFTNASPIIARLDMCDVLSVVIDREFPIVTQCSLKLSATEDRLEVILFLNFIF